MPIRSMVLFAGAAAIAGYALAGSAVTAQSQPFPFAIGDTVTLRYERLFADRAEETVRCNVADIRGQYVRCTRDGLPQFQEMESWRSMEKVVQITRQPR
jgi:hypothetical protein